MDFGSKSLSHPLLVEAAESLFVPVCIYNNKDGADAAVLQRYQEPAWNNPVVRYVDAEGKDLIPREDRHWSTGSLARRMVLALEAAGQEVPGYLRLAAEETGAAEPARATFAMHCFWEGEARLGGVAGVLSTQAAFLQGKEVVEVTFDAARLSYADLLAAALRLECATTVFARTDAQARAARAHGGVTVVRTDELARPAPGPDQAHALRRSPLRYVPMTPAQRTRVNATVAAGGSPRDLLSPRQRALVPRIEALRREDPRALDGLAPPSGGREWQAYVSRLLGQD